MIDLFDAEMEWLDDTPWADPAIEAAYKAALGSFLVQFNAIENLLTEVLDLSFRSLRRPDLLRLNEPFERRLQTLELIGLALPRMHVPNFEDLRALAKERNNLAHGHFDQNPHSGAYSIVTRGGKMTDWPVELITALENRALIAWADLRDCLAFHWYDPDGSMPGREQ